MKLKIILLKDVKRIENFTITHKQEDKFNLRYLQIGEFKSNELCINETSLRSNNCLQLNGTNTNIDFDISIGSALGPLYFGSRVTFYIKRTGFDDYCLDSETSQATIGNSIRKLFY